MNLTDWSVSAYLETLPPALDVSSLHPVTFSPPDLSRNDDVIQVIMLNNSAQPGISISNLTSPVEETCRFRPTTENYLVVVAFIAIFLLSVIGNALVIVVIMQQRAMRSITNIYLMNLAITDLMLSVVCMPPTLVSMVMNCWLFGNMMCKLFAYLQPMVVTASAYTLAVIAFERYFAICKPLHSRIWQTRSHAYAMISLVWLIALVANVLMLFMYEEQTYNLNGLTCTPIHAPVYHFANQVYMTIVLLAIPLVVMTVLYGSVIRTLKMGIRLEIAAVENSIDNDNSTEEVDAVSRKPSVLEKLSAKLTLGAKKYSCKTKKQYHTSSK